MSAFCRREPHLLRGAPHFLAAHTYRHEVVFAAHAAAVARSRALY